jgi:hypothetical protein
MRNILLNYLEKICHSHVWKKTYGYASLSMFDQSGIIYTGQKCTSCHKERTRIVNYRADGSIEKEYIR